MTEDEKSFILRHPLFEGLPQQIVDNLIGHAVPRDYPKGHMLFERGSSADHFFFVLSGWVKVFRVTPAGSEAVLGVFSQGESIAEAAAFMGGGYPASAEIVDPARVLAVPTGPFLNQLRQDPDIALNMLASMSRHMHRFVGELEMMKSSTATERVLKFLAKQCSVQSGSAVVALPYDKTLLARRLGMQPESLSRILGRLRQYGITTEQNRVVISDVRVLFESEQQLAGMGRRLVS